MAILDADKEGFLRSARALTQTAGRAARNVNGRVIFYGDNITPSMRQTMDETARRREKQLRYNELHHITPKTVMRSRKSLKQEQEGGFSDQPVKEYPIGGHPLSVAEEKLVKYMSVREINQLIKSKTKALEAAVKDLDFVEAARLRDEIRTLKEKYA